jgi:hypothetical protein
MISDNKEEELQFLHSFRHFCADFPTGSVLTDETPDFIIEDDGYRVGIEITRIFTTDGRSRASPQSIEAARDRITARSRDLAADLGVSPRNVTLFFNHTLPLPRQKEGGASHP